MAKIKFNKEKSRDRKINFHYREFELNDKTYHLDYCSGPSFLATGRTDQLFMQIYIIPKNKRENIEVYVLKRYPIKVEDAIQHISVNPKTREINIIKNNKSLEEFLSSLTDKETLGDLLNSFPDYERPNRSISPNKKITSASDYDLMNMFFKHLELLRIIRA